MADEDKIASASLGDALTPAEQAYMDSGGQNAEALIAENAGTAAAGADAPKAEDTTGKPSPDGAAKPGDAAKPDAKDAKPSADAKPDAKADGADEGDDDDEPEAGVVVDPTKLQKTVSFHKFNRIKTKLAKEAEDARAATAERDRELNELREKFARGDERLQLLSEALTPKEGDKKADDDPEPDAKTDIFAWIEWSKRDRARLVEQVQSARQDVGKTQETIQQRDAANDLKTNFQRDAVAFAQKAPDFIHAYNHLLNTRASTLELQGYTADEIRTQLAADERGIVQRAIAQRKSPAEVIYGMARSFGYVKQAPAPAPADGKVDAKADAAAGNGNGAAKPTVADEIARIKAGQDASKTLSGSGGAANPLSIEALYSMPEDEFQALYAKRKGDVDALMGKRH